MTRDELEHIIRASGDVTDQKDREFCMALLEHGHVKDFEAIALVDTMPLDEHQQRRLLATIRRWVKVLRDEGHRLQDPSPD